MRASGPEKNLHEEFYIDNKYLHYTGFRTTQAIHLLTKTNNMKQLSLCIMAAMAVLFTACNNKPKEEAAAPAATSNTPMNIAPYKGVMVQHAVAD
jgi:hypothetical protein